jgi:triphosphoribosyl-dephospho-CoA synthase
MRGFTDSSYFDFVLSAAAIAPILAKAPEQGIGETILEAVRQTKLVVRNNTNLGIILLLTPLAAVNWVGQPREDLNRILSKLTVREASFAYQAIRLAQPGGLGESAEEDVRGEPTLGLREVMALAAERDLIARQYANGFADIFDHAVPILRSSFKKTRALENAIILTHLHLMWQFPDTSIARKMGQQEARMVSERAKMVIEAGWPDEEAARVAFAGLDSWLRENGNGRNPGATADLIAATLFVSLQSGEIRLPFEQAW